MNAFRKPINIRPEVFIGLNDKIKLTIVSGSPQVIIDVVCNYFNITNEQIIMSTNKREIVMPRQIAMYLLTQNTNWTLKGIGQYFGRDHSTVIYAKQTVEDLMDCDKKFKQKVTEIKKILKVK